jgi:hypothetical protein
MDAVVTHATQAFAETVKLRDAGFTDARENEEISARK